MTVDSTRQTRYFFAGKGGVGKSTTAALSALKASNNGKKCALVSMDPAHNLGDIFQQRFKEKPLKYNDALWIKEVDVQHWMKRYLRETEEQVSRRYNYHRAFALNNYFKVLKFSPGLEEYALMYAFGEVLKTFREFDVLIFDMPPTALTLRFFALPALSLVWLEELTRLRREIYQKKEIISRVRKGKADTYGDNILEKLQQMTRNQQQIQHILQDQKTRVNLVVNEDELSIGEARHIQTKLQDLDKPVYRVVLNKAISDIPGPDILKQFPGAGFSRLSMSGEPLTGLERMQVFLSAHESFLKDEF